MSEAHRATEGFDACEVAAAHEVMALAFDSGEVARPAVESPALKGHFKVDEERPTAFTVRTGQDLQQYATRLSRPEISRLRELRRGSGGRRTRAS